MRLSHWAIAILIGSVLSCGGTADFTGPTAIDTPGAVSFADLGWTDDVVVKGDSPSATVDVILPEDVEQGNPLWYGVRLDFEISGTPGLPEDAAYLNQGQGGMCIRLRRGIGLGIWQKCFGP